VRVRWRHLNPRAASHYCNRNPLSMCICTAWLAPSHQNCCYTTIFLVSSVPLCIVFGSPAIASPKSYLFFPFPFLWGGRRRSSSPWGAASPRCLLRVLPSPAPGLERCLLSLPSPPASSESVIFTYNDQRRPWSKTIAVYLSLIPRVAASPPISIAFDVLSPFFSVVDLWAGPTSYYYVM